MGMSKPAKPLSDVEAERLYRDHLLPRYLRVVGRIGDNIVIEPRGEHFFDMTYSVTGALERKLRLVVGPIVKPGAPVPKK